MVTHIVSSLGLSTRKACILVDLSRTAYGYQSHQGDDTMLRKRLGELAGQRKRVGLRLHIMFKRGDLVVNHKRTEHVYREESLRIKRNRRSAELA